MSRMVPIHVGQMPGVQAGIEAQIKLPNGPTYQEIVLDTNLPKAEILRIRINLGGVHQMGDIVDVSGSELQTVELYKGQTIAGDDLNRYVIPFGNIDAKVDAGMLYSGLVSLKTDNIILYVELAGAVTPATPSIDVFADATVSQQTRTMIPYIRKQRITNNATGEIDIVNLSQREQIKRLHLKADIVSVLMKIDGSDHYDRTFDVNEFQLKRLGKVPQVGYFHMDFAAHGYPLADLKNPKANFQYLLRPTLGTAEDVVILAETVLMLEENQYQSA